jgi:cobalt-zinc-cadmium efflux system membrane fusion protein
MNRWFILEASLCLSVLVSFTGCDRKVAAATQGGAPPAAVVEPEIDVNNFKVDHPEHFPFTTAGEHVASPELNVTGVVSADVSRQVPVISLGSGRVVEIDARLGDEVKKGQLLFKLRSTDISGAFSDYRQAVANEKLTKVQLNRSKILYDGGAIPKSALRSRKTPRTTRLWFCRPRRSTCTSSAPIRIIRTGRSLFSPRPQA